MKLLVYGEHTTLVQTNEDAIFWYMILRLAGVDAKLRTVSWKWWDNKRI